LTVVTAGNAPAIVEDSLIASLREWTAPENDILTLKPSMQPGDTVQIVAGPMQGLSGTILSECSERNRVKLLLSFLQEGAHLSVDRADLRLIA
jgi:transcription antitermination factor NusG